MILSRGYKIGDKLPTYRDLAEHLGIAVRTVERVMRDLSEKGIVQLLHGKGAFVTKLPVLAGRLAEVGLVYPASRLHLLRTGYLTEILAGVIIECDLQHVGLQIVAFRESGRPAYAPVAPRELARRIDGILLLEVVNDRYIAEFAQEAIPLVLVDAQTAAAPLHSVCVDNAGAVRQIMDHLHALGHRRIAYVDALAEDPLARPNEPRWIDSPDGRERRDAYLAELRRLNLDYQRIYTPAGGELPAMAREVVAQIQRERHRPTALLAFDEPLAASLCEVLPVDMHVPQAISVAGAVAARGGSPAAGFVVTTSIADFEAMGRTAMELLQAQATGRSLAAPTLRRIGTTFRPGTSTAPPAN